MVFAFGCGLGNKFWLIVAEAVSEDELGAIFVGFGLLYGIVEDNSFFDCFVGGGFDVEFLFHFECNT